MRPASRPIWACLLAVSFAACGDSSARPERARPGAATASTPAPARTAAPQAAQPGYELHGWGFVAFDAEPPAVLRAISAPHRADVRPTLAGSFAVDSVDVIHLRRSAVDGPSTNVSVRLLPGNGAQVLERWPRTTGRVDAWNDLVVRRGPCPEATYPTTTDEVCATADGRCDSANGRGYESQDADCLANDAIAARQLSFRSTLARSRLPFDVRVRDDVAVLASVNGAGESARVFRVRRAGGADATWASFQTPAADESIALPAPGDATDPVAAVMAEVPASKLSAGERAAFARTLGERMLGESAPRDALYYVVPDGLIDALVPIESTPAAAASTRVLVVRLSLDDYVRPPRSRDPEPTIRVRTDGLPTVSGGSVDAHRRVVLEHAEELEACALRAFRPGVVLAERLVVRYQVASNGVVRSATVEDPVGANRLVVACVESAFLTFTFPESRSPVAIGRIPLSILALPPR